jgi:hypothetical protein
MYRIYPKVGLIEIKGGGKEGAIVNNNETHHICVGTRHNETHCVKQHRRKRVRKYGGGRGLS